jgi:hypothetical protein
LPLSIVIPRKTKEDKVFILNLKRYRNTHHMTLNQAKANYKEAVEAAAKELGELGPPPYKFVYTVYPSSSRAFDLANVLPIIQKFTDDALIELGVISEDNYKIIRSIAYEFGAVDKDNPRAELEIIGVTLPE